MSFVPLLCSLIFFVFGDIFHALCSRFFFPCPFHVCRQYLFLSFSFINLLCHVCPHLFSPSPFCFLSVVLFFSFPTPSRTPLTQHPFHHPLPLSPHSRKNTSTTLPPCIIKPLPLSPPPSLLMGEGEVGRGMEVGHGGKGRGRESQGGRHQNLRGQRVTWRQKYGHPGHKTGARYRVLAPLPLLWRFLPPHHSSSRPAPLPPPSHTLPLPSTSPLPHPNERLLSSPPPSLPLLPILERILTLPSFSLSPPDRILPFTSTSLLIT